MSHSNYPSSLFSQHKLSDFFPLLRSFVCSFYFPLAWFYARNECLFIPCFFDSLLLRDCNGPCRSPSAPVSAQAEVTSPARSPEGCDVQISDPLPSAGPRCWGASLNGGVASSPARKTGVPLLWSMWETHGGSIPLLGASSWSCSSQPAQAWMFLFHLAMNIN